MRRRDFIMLLGSGAVWPLAAVAQRASAATLKGKICPLTFAGRKEHSSTIPVLWLSLLTAMLM